MKILILGASGMIGLAIYNHLIKNKNFRVIGTTTNSKAKHFIENQNNLNSLILFDFLKDNNIEGLLKSVKPNIIINCIGIIKQSTLISNKINTIFLNSILPNKLSILALKNGIKLIQISTDCVFSGKIGSYMESDNPDPTDTYGRTKLIGEITNDSSLTLRTSLVGHELFTKNGLLEWFLSQKYECIGFKNALFSGFTTTAFAKILETILTNKEDLKGLYHVSSKVISKYDFLKKINKVYNKNIKINEDHSFKIDRSLISSALEEKIKYKVETWDIMIKEMFKERFLYVQK